MRTRAVTGDVITPFLCWRCAKKLADSAGPGSSQRCRGCGARNRAPTAEEVAQIDPPSDATRPTAIDRLTSRFE